MIQWWEDRERGPRPVLDVVIEWIAVIVGAVITVVQVWWLLLRLPHSTWVALRRRN
jgi:hypothetical protein